MTERWKPKLLPLSGTELENIRKDWHLEEELTELALQLGELLTPVFQYRISGDGNKWLEAAVTLGCSLDRLEESWMEQGELGRVYAADCLSLGWLEKLYGEFSEELGRRHGLWISRFYFPEEEAELSALAESVGKGVLIRAPGRMISPAKSLLFCGSLTADRKKACGGICAACTSATCERRKERGR